MQPAAIAMAEQPRSGCTKSAQGCRVPRLPWERVLEMEATPLRGCVACANRTLDRGGNFDPLLQPILDLTIRRNPVGVAVILRPITQRSRAEAGQPWAMLHNRFAVEPQGQA